LLIENKHFVAFRTLPPYSCPLGTTILVGRTAASLRLGMELAGRTALLTGATGGLGRAIARALAGRDAVLLLSARKPEALEALAAELPGEGHRALPADLAEPGAAEKLAGEAGQVDILVANAGLPGAGPLGDFTPEQVSRTLRVNLEAPMLMAQALSPAMLERGSGHLVFIASLAGKAGSPLSSVYSATKFGLRGFALGLRTDLGPKGVGVSLVSPGFIREAGMFAEAGAKPPPGMGTGTPEQVAGAVVKAIERDKVELAVAPLRQRALAHIALASPSVSARAQSGAAGQKAAEAITSGHSPDKR
jgi:short-subunit dehydrogenase